MAEHLGGPQAPEDVASLDRYLAGRDSDQLTYQRLYGCCRRRGLSLGDMESMCL